MLQLIFSKKNRTTGVVWSHELPALPADFMAEYDALSPRMTYGVDMGWKQSLSDSYVSAETEDEFRAALIKKANAFVSGTIRAVSGAVRVVKTPLEQMVLTIAGERIDKRLAETGTKKTAAERAALIELYGSARYADIVEEAQTRLAADTKIASPEALAELDALMGPMVEKAVESPKPEAPAKKRAA